MELCAVTHDESGNLTPVDACDWINRACAVWKTEDGVMMGTILWNAGRFSIEGEFATPDDLAIAYCPGCGRPLQFVNVTPSVPA